MITLENSMRKIIKVDREINKDEDKEKKVVHPTPLQLKEALFKRRYNI